MKPRSVLFSLVTFLILSQTVLAQERRILFGASAGTAVVASSYKNLMAYNKELGASVIYTFKHSPYELQGNFFWCRRSIRGVFILYTDLRTLGFYAYKPVYDCFENSLQVNYRIKQSQKKVLKLNLGIGYNFLSFAKLEDRDRSMGPGSIALVPANYSDYWNYDKVQTLSFILGIISERKFKRSGKPYSWSLQYQKTLKRAPNFSYTGDIQINSTVYHKNISISPYLDALSLRFTYYPLAVRLK